MSAPAEQVKKNLIPSAVSQPAAAKTNDELPVLRDQPSVYNTAKTPASEKEPVTKVSEPLVAEKTKPFIPNLHAASTSIKIPSLKDLGSTTAAEIAEEDDPYIKGDAKEDFTMDAFLKYWSDYAAKLKADRNMSLFTIFTANAPVMLKPYHFEVIVGIKPRKTCSGMKNPA